MDRMPAYLFDTDYDGVSYSNAPQTRQVPFSIQVPRAPRSEKFDTVTFPGARTAQLWLQCLESGNPPLYRAVIADEIAREALRSAGVILDPGREFNAEVAADVDDTMRSLGLLTLSSPPFAVDVSDDSSENIVVAVDYNALPLESPFPESVIP